MAILQALLALITKSAGKILNAIFGWAVHALFGRTTPRDQTLLSALVGAAVVWPLLVAGIAAPKVAAFALAFVPIPHFVPPWTIRIVWSVLALAVPVTLGLTLAARNPVAKKTGKHEAVVTRVLRGFPVTIGLALAFLIMFVSVPIMRLVSLVKREKSADVPLMTDVDAYHEVADQLVATLNAHGFDLHATEPAWWVKAPTRILGWFGGAAFSGFVPQTIEHYNGKDVELSFYTSGILLRGRGQRATWAHGLIVEASIHGRGLQTFAPAAQEIERHVRELWRHFDADKDAHEGSAVILGNVQDLTRQLAKLDVDYDEWQVIYRQLLQLERAVRGEPQLLDDATDGTTKSAIEGTGRKSMKDDGTGSKEAISPQKVTKGPELAPRPPTLAPYAAAQLSTGELLREIGEQVQMLARTELDLVKNELRANVKSEATTVAGLGVAAMAGVIAVNLLLVTVILALAQALPGWQAGLIVSGAVLAVAAIAGGIGWSKRVQKPLDRTRHELKEDVQWTKEHLA